MLRNCWTFSIPGTGSLVITPLDGEGFLLLNATASWLWHNRELPGLSFAYAEHFGITLDQADIDISRTFSHWAGLIAPPTCLTVQIHQTTFSVTLETQALVEELIPRLQALLASEIIRPHHTFRLHQSNHGCHIEKDGQHFVTEPLITGARAQLLQELTRLAVPGRNFTSILHAGACGDQAGCILLVGASFAGKSTLCRALMELGLLCYSDDSACLTDNFQVAGMPFALALRETPRFRPSNLNGMSPTAPPKAIVFIDFQPGSKTRLEPLDAFEALLSLQQAGFWIDHTATSISAFLEWLGQLPRYRLTYPDRTEALPVIINLL